MKLYHITLKSIYDNYIKKEGLKEIIDPYMRSTGGETGIYFFDDINKAKKEGEIFTDFKRDWLILEVDINDIVDTCKCLSKDREYIKGSYYGTSNIEGKTVKEFSCTIIPSKIKIVFEKKQDAS